MNRLVLSVLVLGLSVGPFASAVSAASVDDLVNLRAHGLSDQLLIELIEVDGSSFQLTPDDVIALHDRGLSDAVLRAMIRTGRRSVAALSETAPAIAAPPPAVVLAVPINVTVSTPVVVAVVEHRPRPPVKAPEPVYWGFGGKLRPDAWKPAPEPVAAPTRDESVRSSAKSR
jgi:hypothetical protein